MKAVSVDLKQWSILIAFTKSYWTERVIIADKICGPKGVWFREFCLAVVKGLN